MIRRLLSKLSPVPKLDYERVKHSCPDRPELRRHRYDVDKWRHRIRRPELVVRRRGA